MDESTDEQELLDDVDEQARSFADGDLGTIQNILFGNQAQQYEHRLAELEARLDAALHTEQENRIVAIDELRLQAVDRWDHSTNELHDLRRVVDAERAEMQSRLDKLGAQRETVAELLERTASMLRIDVHSPAADS